jgi:hypothetical protein
MADRFPVRNVESRIPPPGETFCHYCIAEFEYERADSARKPDEPISPMTGLPYDPAPEQSDVCVRCRAPLGDDDDCWHRPQCLIALAAKELEESGVQLPLGFFAATYPRSETTAEKV